MARRPVTRPAVAPSPVEAEPQPVEVAGPVAELAPEVVEEPKADEPAGLTVKAVFAHATLKTGEVRMLSKGDVVDVEQFDEKSLAHLVGIGFIG